MTSVSDVAARADAARPAADAATYPDARERRRALADELLDALTDWTPRDRMGTFRHWHQGSLSLVHLNVIAALEAEGALSMHGLAETLDVSQASATGIVDRMERRGLVIRRHSTDDRRLVLVDLAPTGAGLFKEMGLQRRDHLSRLLGELSEDELSGFLAGLRAMRAAGARLKAAQADGPQAGGCPPSTQDVPR